MKSMTDAIMNIPERGMKIFLLPVETFIMVHPPSSSLLFPLFHKLFERIMNGKVELFSLFHVIYVFHSRIPVILLVIAWDALQGSSSTQDKVLQISLLKRKNCLEVKHFHPF